MKHLLLATILLLFFHPHSGGVTSQGYIKPYKNVKSLTEPLLQPQANLDTIVTTLPLASAPVPAGVSSCGDNQWANFIYTNESGCRTGAINPIGCEGIGQSCPGSVIREACPNLDYDCENQFYTNYANNHCDYHLGYAICYGGWEGAYNFWVQFHYW